MVTITSSIVYCMLCSLTYLASMSLASFLSFFSFTLFFFFFNDTAPTEIYTLSLHDALPISPARPGDRARQPAHLRVPGKPVVARSEEHTSELQSPCNLVCRLLLEKKKKKRKIKI